MVTPKSIFRIQFVLLAILTFACREDDDKKEKAFSFKDQDVKGKVWGTDWEYLDGRSITINPGAEAILGFGLYSTYNASLCDAQQTNQHFVSFGVPAQVGLYELSYLELGVQLFNIETGNAIYLSEGAIEILTISETEITGRIDARKDDSNTINGNFIVPVCEAPENEPQ